MDNPDAVMAVSAAVSAAVALGALALSVIGLVRSKSAAKDAQAAREGMQTAQWKMSEHLEAIAAALARGAPQPRGKLSARLERRGRGHRLIVANVGTAPVTVEGVEVEPSNTVLGTEDLAGVELEPGEDHSLPAAITFGTKLPLAVALRWQDSSGESEERTQAVPLS